MFCVSLVQVSRMKQKDANKLNEEYQRLVRGLQESGVLNPGNADANIVPAGPGEDIPREDQLFSSLLYRAVAPVKGQAHLVQCRASEVATGHVVCMQSPSCPTSCCRRRYQATSGGPSTSSPS
jgi:hypothetical protein